ncbi:PLP-dependent aminotransferase family protein [Acinetobacter sp. ANC 3832]|uniref:aminotransferase-like domain-containing protein n=1 Tax=Acinetobacter sp. ANC 3832 TaxID=1977874 RepID=UPI000A335832|nr:PLP-dependent aminotransferase family protein [Acinetobacter sp. ANC 3832]OTG92360.1 GntR family transcriptional regulator [Acinetobacter sp. ANC 3832]
MKQNEFIQILQGNLSNSKQKKLKTKVYLAIKESLIQLQLQQDFKCPSSRFLSETIGVSRDTVEKTYDQLEQEGMLYRIKGKGSFAKATPTKTVIDQQNTHYSLPENSERLEALFFDQNLNFFADGMPEIRNFPFRKWYDTEKDVLTQNGLSIFLKDNSAGNEQLRHEIAHLVNLNRDCHINAENVLIVNSTQQALYLCGRVLFQENDRIILENPYYSNAYHLFKMMNLDVQCIVLDEQGLQIEQCEQLECVKAMYITPANQYPSGIQMSLARKKQVIDYAQKHEAYIIEDDYDAFMLNKAENSAILGLDPYQRTIYLGSFSKYILPSLKLSYLILPNQLIEPFKRYRNYIEGSAPSQYYQAILASFMQKGYYAEYLAEMQKIYLTRYLAFKQYFEIYLSDFCFIKEHHPSMQIACYFKKIIPSSLEDALVKAAEVQKIYITRLSQFYDFDLEYGFVLGFSSLNDTEIKLCMTQLRQLIQSELARIIK